MINTTDLMTQTKSCCLISLIAFPWSTNLWTLSYTPSCSRIKGFHLSLLYLYTLWAITWSIFSVFHAIQYQYLIKNWQLLLSKDAANYYTFIKCISWKLLAELLISILFFNSEVNPMGLASLGRILNFSRNTMES